MFLSLLFRLISHVIALFMVLFKSKTQKQQVSLKLLVNTDTNKVLFAEADKDFVDILCSFLTLPLGTISQLLQKESNMLGPVTIGCMNSLCQSVEKLGLQPTYNSSEDYCDSLKININDFLPKKFYFICNRSHNYEYHCPYLSIGTNTNKNYCICGNRLSRSVSMTNLCNGFVRDDTSFVIFDDLIVLPHSMDQTVFSLTKNLGIKSTSAVIEMTVNVTMEKVLDLLKCSLFSKTPLTDIFLGMKPIIERSMVFSFDDVKDIFEGNINIAVKLVVRKSDENILYAQGGQDLAELIIRFLTFPLGGVLRKLEGNCSLGSIGGLSKSIADLNQYKYFTSKEAKNRLLLLSDLQYYYTRENTHDGETKVMLCKDQDHANLDKSKLINTITTPPLFGYINSPKMYVVMDDLIIEPLLSPMSSVYLLQRFKTPLNDLEEKVVTIGKKESLSIFKAALTSTSALTNGLRHLLTKVKKEK